MFGDPLEASKLLPAKQLAHDIPIHHGKLIAQVVELAMLARLGFFVIEREIVGPWQATACYALVENKPKPKLRA